jgi:hypothetical protein
MVKFYVNYNNVIYGSKGISIFQFQMPVFVIFKSFVRTVIFGV